MTLGRLATAAQGFSRPVTAQDVSFAPDRAADALNAVRVELQNYTKRQPTPNADAAPMPATAVWVATNPAAAAVALDEAILALSIAEGHALGVAYLVRLGVITSAAATAGGVGAFAVGRSPAKGAAVGAVVGLVASWLL